MSQKHLTNELYVIIEQLPEDQRKLFEEWLVERTMPVIEELEQAFGRIVLCAYKDDYNYWYEIQYNNPFKQQDMGNENILNSRTEESI